MDFNKAPEFLGSSGEPVYGTPPDPSDPFIAGLIENCLGWPGEPLKRHNDASHALHQMHLLLDLGFGKKDAFMHDIASKIFENQSCEGAFMVNMHVSEHYGGTGQPGLTWMLCDFPLLLEFLIALGYGNDARVQKAISFLLSLGDDNGWRCKGSLPGFRGPGKKTDYCPAATLFSLRALSCLPQYHSDTVIIKGLDSLFDHWSMRKEKKFYLFGMGTDFMKLKYPTVWFDIVHLARVLSRYEYAQNSPVFKEWLSIISDKQMPDGGFVPESIYTAYKSLDFGQKKTSSPTLTRIICDITNSGIY